MKRKKGQIPLRTTHLVNWPLSWKITKQGTIGAWENDSSPGGQIQDLIQTQKQSYYKREWEWEGQLYYTLLTIKACVADGISEISYKSRSPCP